MGKPGAWLEMLALPLFLLHGPRKLSGRGESNSKVLAASALPT